jgi:hypothetical protein
VWRRIVAAGAVVLAAGAGGVAQQVSAHDARAHPALRILRMAPLSVRGSGFHPRERVRVRLRSPETSATRRVRSTGRGAFTAGFRVPVDRCSGFTVTAVDGSGRRATVVRRALECPVA